MDKTKLSEILNIGESFEIEFKETRKSLPKSIWSTYSTFANSKGGIIVLGVKENKAENTFNIEGVENYNSILKDFWNAINDNEKVSSNILDYNDVCVIDVDAKKVIVITVPNVNPSRTTLILDMKKDSTNYTNNYTIISINEPQNVYIVNKTQLKIIEIIKTILK